MIVRLLPLLLAALALAACDGGSNGALTIAFIDSPDTAAASDLRLSSAAPHMRAATESGLVALDAQGEVVPALADRWIVTDDGLNFIFRLRDGAWPDGTELTADSVKAELVRLIRRSEGTALGLDLAPIEEVRATAGSVIEIRLSSAVPTLLQLLAQPEMVLDRGAGGTGQMLLRQQGRSAILTMKPPSARGLPEEPDWRQRVRPIALFAMDVRQAVAGFDEGRLDLVLGGRIGDWPLADTGPLSRGTVRIDPALGLFGVQVRRAAGLLADATGREALAMAIDRPALIAPFNIGGWVPTTRIVAPALPGDPGYIVERWADLSIEQRRAIAAVRVARWRAQNGGQEPRLSLALARSPGHDQLFALLAAQWAGIGVTLVRAAPGAPADLALVDRVARYAEPRWFLNQFHCSLRRGLCDEDADFLLAQANRAADPAARATLLAEVEAQLMLKNIYIPFGQPLRWSLVRGRVDGFAANQWAFHPLPPLAQIAR